MKTKRIELIYQIAKWEFMRWFKWKDQFISLFVTLIIGIMVFGLPELLLQKKEIKISVINGDLLPIDLKSTNLRFVKEKPENVVYLKKAVTENKLKALVIVKNVDTVVLYTRKSEKWTSELVDLFSKARMEHKVKLLNISRQELNSVLNGISLIQSDETREKKIEKSEIAASAVFLAIMLLAIFLSLSYQFIAITGEKQLHITEQIVAAVSPQTWIDGKIIGLSALSFALTIVYIIDGLVFYLLSVSFGAGWQLPLTFANLGIIFLLAVFSIGGLFIWNTFFAAVAATINDPNTSARSAFLFLPLLPTGLSFITLMEPNSQVIRVLSILPITSTSFMSARLVVTSVPFYEIGVSFLFMMAALYLLRRSAGKVFELSILMRGKEPTFMELRKWLRQKNDYSKI